LSALTQGGSRLNPPHTEKAQEVVKALLREIIPRYGLPLSIGSENGPAFMAEIVQGLAKILKIKWKLHTVYRPQSSGKVEHMNRTLKITLAKLCQETQSPWIDMLPLALLRAC
jgi:transposase InsO family protein